MSPNTESPVVSQAVNNGYEGWYHALQRAYAASPLTGVFKARLGDFQVTELLDVDLTGDGEHHWLQLKKSNLNTVEVAEKLARYARVPARNVSYSGLKDKRAVTTQWFSVHLPGQSLDALNWPGIELLDWRDGGVELLLARQHSRKLRRGTHKANHFRIVIRDLQTESAADSSLLDDVVKDRLSALAKNGVPNYFGAQRFGFHASNLVKAQSELLSGRKLSRHKKSLYLSSVRAFLFNELLAARIADNSWNTFQPGDRLVLNGRQSFFVPDEADLGDIEQRLALGDIHIGGMLAGSSAFTDQNAAEYNQYERRLFARFPEWREPLEKFPATSSVRALRVIPESLEWSLPEGERKLLLDFQLPSGSFATALLRELGNFFEPDKQN